MSTIKVTNLRHESATSDNISLDSSANTTIGGNLIAQAGSASTPAIQATGDANTRIYFSGADAVDVATGGTQALQLDSSQNLKFNSGFGSVATAYGCRAWVNFNGTGTVAIRASGNVSSITDNGTGDYTVNFTTAMPDANYVVAGSTVGNTLGSSYISFIGTNFNTVNTTSSFRFKNYVFNASNVDNDNVSIAVIR